MRDRSRWLALAGLLGAVSIVGWSYLSGGIAQPLLSLDVPGPEKIHHLQAYFEEWGNAAPLIYAILVALEVIVAPLPGAMMYLPGGLIFGWQLGGAVSLAGNVLGAGLCCAIARALGRPFAERLIDREALLKYDALLARNAVWVILLLRINPLTSSDLVSYAAGFTSMSIWRVMLGTLLGMAPLCFLQAYFAQELFTRFPLLLYPLALACVLYVSYVVWLLSRRRPATGPVNAKIRI